MTLCPIVGEARVRGGSSSFLRVEGTAVAKRFLQLASQRTHLMRRVVIQRWSYSYPAVGDTVYGS